MHVGKTVTVVCEDTGQTQEGLVENISGRNLVSISINPKLPLMLFSETKKGIWVCRSAGLEFTVRL